MGLEVAMRKHGTPQHIRSDNAPEFVAYAIQDCMEAKQIKTLYIKPGSPWENAYIERLLRAAPRRSPLRACASG